MLLQGTVLNGVIVPDAGVPLPAEGTRVTMAPVEGEPSAERPDLRRSPTAQGLAMIERYAKYVVDSEHSPGDLASQHDHYRLGTPKR